jgi:hypothetical protein
MEMLPVLLSTLVLLVATTRILALKVGTSIHPACLPCWPAGLVGLPAFLVCQTNPANLPQKVLQNWPLRPVL